MNEFLNKKHECSRKRVDSKETINAFRDVANCKISKKPLTRIT